MLQFYTNLLVTIATKTALDCQKPQVTSSDHKTVDKNYGLAKSHQN
jgi:hypothetical protein